MPSYDAGHQFFLQYMIDNGSVNESNGSISAPSGSWADVGYTNPANIVSSDSIEKGYGAGLRTPLYDKKGRRTHSLSADLRIGAASDLKTIYDSASYLALRWGIDNSWASRLRQAVLSTLTLNFTEEQEISAACQFEAVAREDSLTPVNTDYSFGQFGSQLFWQNVMDFTIGGDSLRDALMSMTVQVENNIERKGIRPDWGDDAAMSRTPYGLMFHHKNVSGTLNFHEQLAASYFTSADDSTDWGDVVINCNDTAAGGSKTFVVTLSGVRPASRNQQGVESSAQLQYSVDYVANNMTIALS